MKRAFELVIELQEALDSHFDDIVWTDDIQIQGEASLKDERFTLYLEPQAYRLPTGRKLWLNVAFARHTTNGLTQELLSDTKNPTSVLGAVAHALREKIAELQKEYEFDALVFLVKHGEEKRLRTYRRLFNSFLIDPWAISGEVVTLGGRALLATAEKLDDVTLSQLKQELQSRGKTLI